jgi:hypothetical protein
VSVMHLEDSEIDQLLDGGDDGIGPASWAHLSACDRCQRRVRQARSTELLLAAVTERVPVTARRPQLPWRSMGAVVLVMAATVLLFIRMPQYEASSRRSVASSARTPAMELAPDGAVELRSPPSVEAQDGRAVSDSVVSRGQRAAPTVARAGRPRVPPSTALPSLADGASTPASGPFDSARLLPMDLPRSRVPSQPAPRSEALVSARVVQPIVLLVCDNPASLVRARVLSDSLRLQGRGVRRRVVRDTVRRAATDMLVCLPEPR